MINPFMMFIVTFMKMSLEAQAKEEFLTVGFNLVLMLQPLSK